ncbi:MAG: glycosyltransferase family 2 protein [Lachnospiraceae bacterium]
MENGIVSIIVPVYNSAQFLDKCVDSIINQTYKNIEVLLIDDCSTDNSYEKMLHYAENDSRVRCFKTLKNSGPSAARNIGLDNASGKWVSFVDSDDMLEAEYAQIMVDEILRTGADMVICGLKNYFQNRTEEEHAFSGDKVFEKQDFDVIRRILLTRKTETGNSGIEVTGPVCKLISLEMIGCYRFCEDMNLGEDTHFVVRCLDSVGRVAYATKTLYCRVVRDDSLSYRADTDFNKRRATYVNCMLLYLNEHGYSETMKNDFVYFNLKEVVHYYTTHSVSKCRKFIGEYNEMVNGFVDFRTIDDKLIIKWVIQWKLYIIYKLIYFLYSHLR